MEQGCLVKDKNNTQNKIKKRAIGWTLKTRKKKNIPDLEWKKKCSWA